MFTLESQWIARQIKAFAPTAKTVIDIGSESLHYRTTKQLHIAELYNELQDRGMTITTLDADKNCCPDIVCDITKPVEGLGTYDIVIAANILEHVPTDKISNVVDNLTKLKSPGGILIVTVPHNLPRHDRPIDTMLRPTAIELTSLVNRVALIAETWVDQHFREPYISNPAAILPMVTGGIYL